MIANLRIELHRLRESIKMKRAIMKTDLKDIWVHQTSLYGLGNFINLTPSIRLLSEHYGKKIPVYFDLEFIRDCFLDCPFMEILEERPLSSPMFSSGLINGMNNCPDYIYVRKMIGQRFPLEGDLPHTYVDTAKEIDAAKVNTLFIRGSGSENKIYLASKMPDNKYYREYFAENLAGDYTEGFTGSFNDVERSRGLFDGMTKYVGGIRLALAMIREADYIVSNDSGLAHAAGAMNKPMTILWVNTHLPKNCNPDKRCNYKMCH